MLQRLDLSHPQVGLLLVTEVLFKTESMIRQCPKPMFNVLTLFLKLVLEQVYAKARSLTENRS